MRHDGTIIAQGEERFITKFENETDEIELASLGIRRWRLQKVLIDEAKRRGIKVILNQRVENVSMTEQGRVVIKLLSGSNIECDLLFGILNAYL